MGQTLSGSVTARETQTRLTFALIVAAVVFVSMIVQLWRLQLLKGNTYRQAAESIATEPRDVPAPRGLIRDRVGRVIAGNRPSYDLWVTPFRAEDPDAMLAELARWLDMEPEQLAKRWRDAKTYSRYKRSLIKADMAWEEVAAIAAHQNEFPGIEISVGVRRTYPYGELFPHVLGYMAEVSPSELEKFESEQPGRFRRGDLIGKKGVERFYEGYLKGYDGTRIVPIDRLGREIPGDQAQQILEDFTFLRVAQRDAVAGHDVVLTIDLGLQQTIAQAFGDKAGAVVVMDVHTGAIRALFTAPAFNPSWFARGLSQTEWVRLRDHLDHPMEDKALRGQYPPGSTFKLFTAAGALENGTIDDHTRSSCSGVYFFGNRPYRCWNKKGHGGVELTKAIQQSCDVYFYQAGTRLGVNKIAEMAKAFGFGARTGIDIGADHEKAGTIPTTEWKRMRFHQEWAAGETLSVAIGQGYDSVTPIQLAVAYAALANGGHVLKPQIVHNIVSPTGEVVKSLEPEIVRDVPLSAENLARLQRGLYAVVNEPGGTAYGSVRIPELHIAGKTGTSQVISQSKDTPKELLDRFKDHALFAAYAPFEDPELAIAVIVEHGEHGSSGAGPIAKAAFAYWFRDEIAAAKRGGVAYVGKQKVTSVEAAIASTEPVTVPTPELVTSDDAARSGEVVTLDPMTLRPLAKGAGRDGAPGADHVIDGPWLPGEEPTGSARDVNPLSNLPPEVP